MGILSASIEMRSISRHPFQEGFIGIHNFLSSTMYPFGVRRIACNFGAGGLGFNYWDQPNHTGDNAWAVFAFTSAATPWYMLLQYTEGSTINTSPGAPGSVVNNPGQTFVVAASMAMRSDGGNPWNGTTNNNGADTKNNVQIWTSGSSANLLWVWPRSNNPPGSYASQMQDMMALEYVPGGAGLANDLFNQTTEAGTGFLRHVFGDQNTFLHMGDPLAVANFNFTYFGQYVPRTDITASFPWIALSAYQSPTDRGPFQNNDTAGPYMQWGQLNGSWDNTHMAGGVLHPSQSNGVVGASFLVPGMTFFSRYEPNKSLFTGSNRYDEFQGYVNLFEEPSYFGFIGNINWFKLSFGQMSTAVSSSGNTAAFNVHYAAGGGNGYPNRVWNSYIKMIVPWTGSVGPYSVPNRLGVQFGQ